MPMQIKEARMPVVRCTTAFPGCVSRPEPFSTTFQRRKKRFLQQRRRDRLLQYCGKAEFPEIAISPYGRFAAGDANGLGNRGVASNRLSERKSLRFRRAHVEQHD